MVAGCWEVIRPGSVVGIRSVAVDVFVSDDDALGGFGPTTVFAKAAIGADGANKAIGGGGDSFSLFNQEFETATCASGAFFEEPEGVGVAVNGAALTEVVFVGEEGWALPMEEALFDGLAFGVVADDAARRVVAEAGVFVSALSKSFGAVSVPTPCRRRKGWGTLNTYFKTPTLRPFFACCAFLKSDHDGKRKLDLGSLKIFCFGRCRDFMTFGKAGIVVHLVFYVVSFKLARLDRFDGRYFVRLEGDNLLCVFNIQFRGAGLTGWE